MLVSDLMVSGLPFMSMSEKAQEASSVIDEVEVTDLSIPSTTVYYVDRSTGLSQPGTVVINGTQVTPPVDNSTGGKNYKCRISQEVCYQCNNCELL